MTDHDDITARVRDSNVEYVYYQFVTLSGRVMAKVVPARHLGRNLERGVQFHGSAITDLASDRHGDLIASGPEREEFLALPDASHVRRAAVGHRVSGGSSATCTAGATGPVDPGAPLGTCVRGNLAARARAVPGAQRARAALGHASPR